MSKERKRLEVQDKIEFLKKSFFDKTRYPSGKIEFSLKKRFEYDYSSDHSFSCRQSDKHKLFDKKRDEFILKKFKKIFLFDLEERFNKSRLSKFFKIDISYTATLDQVFAANIFNLYIHVYFLCKDEFKDSHKVFGSLDLLPEKFRETFCGSFSQDISFEEDDGNFSLDIDRYEPSTVTSVGRGNFGDFVAGKNAKLGKLEDYKNEIEEIMKIEL